MNIKQYMKESARTEAILPLSYDIKPETIHGIAGINAEAGELAGALKKAMTSGKQIDVENIEEELGDIQWYWMVICRSEGLDPEIIMQKNIDKLKTRYPEKFTVEHSIKRLDKNVE